MFFQESLEGCLSQMLCIYCKIHFRCNIVLSWWSGSGWLLRPPKVVVSGPGQVNHKWWGPVFLSHCGRWPFSDQTKITRSVSIWTSHLAEWDLECLWAEVCSKRPWFQYHRASPQSTSGEKGHQQSAWENVQRTATTAHNLQWIHQCLSVVVRIQQNWQLWCVLPLYLCVESFNREIWKLHHFPQTWKSN